MTKINFVQIINGGVTTSSSARDAIKFLENDQEDGPLLIDGLDVFVDENAEPFPDKWSVTHNAYDGVTLTIYR